MTKLILKAFAPIALFSPTLVAGTNTPNTPIQHVIIIAQENRTPDNLFHDDSVLVANGADVIPPSTVLKTACNHQAAALQPAKLDSCWDPDHSHGKLPGKNYKGAWTLTYDGGNMDGACNVHLNVDYCNYIH